MPPLPINLTGSTPAGDLVYPNGDYVVESKEITVEPTKDGSKQMIVVKARILAGPNASNDLQGKPIIHRYCLIDSAKPFLHRFLLAAGITQEMLNAAGGVPNTDWLVGKKYVVRISEKNGNTNVGMERPLEAWTYGGQLAGSPPPTQVTQQSSILGAPMGMPQPPAPQQQMQPQQQQQQQQQQWQQQQMQPPPQQWPQQQQQQQLPPQQPQMPPQAGYQQGYQNANVPPAYQQPPAPQQGNVGYAAPPPPAGNVPQS